MLISSGVHAQNALDDILKRKVIKVAVQTDSAPYGYVGTDLKPIGLDVDMANYIGKKLGVGVELVVVVSSSRIPALQTQKADLAARPDQRIRRPAPDVGSLHARPTGEFAVRGAHVLNIQLQPVEFDGHLLHRLAR